MDRESLEEGLGTVELSIRFLLLIVFGILLSFQAILLQRRQLALMLSGEAPDRVPSPLPLQRSAGAIMVGSLGFFFTLSLRAWREAQTGQDPETLCSTRAGMLASALVLIAAVVRLWALELPRDLGETSLAQELEASLPA